jgi:hypothetical protein
VDGKTKKKQGKAHGLLPMVWHCRGWCVAHEWVEMVDASDVVVFVAGNCQSIIGVSERKKFDTMSIFGVCRSPSHVKYCQKVYDEYLIGTVTDVESHHHGPGLVEDIQILYPDIVGRLEAEDAAEDLESRNSGESSGAEADGDSGGE